MMEDVKLEFKVGLAVKFIKRGVVEEDMDAEGIATQEGAAGVQGFCSSVATMDRAPLISDEE